SAARTFFNTTPDKLKMEEAAVLVGMLKGPSLFSPIRNPERSLNRRNLVLANMMKEGFITKEEYEEAKEKPLKLNLNVTSYGEGPAPYFRAVLKDESKKEFQRLGITKEDGSAYDLDRDGLRIYTPINYDMQLYAEQAQKEWMQKLQKEFDKQWRNRNPFAGERAKLLTTGMKRSDRYIQMKNDGASEEEILKAFNTKTRMTIFTWKG